MFLLIRKYRFGDYRRYTELARLIEINDLRLSFLTNLRISRGSYGTHASASISSDKIRTCLDYLVDEYKNENCKNGLVEFIDHSAIDTLRQRIQLLENIKNVQDLARDTDLKRLAEEEELLYREQLNKVDKKLLDTILDNVCKERYNSIIVEITAGVGGQEAMLFVRDLYEMYMGYVRHLDLSYEVMDIDFTDNKGIRHVSFMVTGERVNKFRYEGGVHRVQRVPTTERSGRVHTSTASVAILPAPSEIEVMINEKDLKIETKRATGAGGQHVNTTDSAIRITHIPTGTVVNCQVDRSQIKNKQMAMTKLRSVLYEQQLEKQTSFMSELRQRQMGARLRNEKIRTYNYNQDRVTDHRLENGTIHDLDGLMQGKMVLEELEGRLHRDMQIKTLVEIVKKLKKLK